MDTKTLQDYDRQYVWHPFTQMREWENEPAIVIERGEGSWLIDTDGNRWLDGVGSIWTNVHGHCRPEINEAIKRQVDKLEHSTLLGLTNEQAVLLAKRLVDITPQGLVQGFLLRQRLDCSRNRHQNGLPVLAAPGTAGEDTASSLLRTPTMATPSARSASAASTCSTRCSAPCCSRPSRPLPPTATGVSSADPTAGAAA